MVALDLIGYSDSICDVQLKVSNLYLVLWLLIDVEIFHIAAQIRFKF